MSDLLPMPSRTSWARTLWHVMLASLIGLALGAGPGAQARNDVCAGEPACNDLGAFSARVIKVNVTRQDAVTAYQSVRSTVRFTNHGDKPLILGWRERSSKVSDDKGLAYNWSSKAHGMGVVARGSADTQFELAPGESRDASFEGVVQYNMRRQVAGSVFSHDIVVVQLVLLDGQRVRELREYPLSFSELRATAGFGANAGASAPTVSTPPVASSAQPPSALPQTASAACADAGSCQAVGPLVAQVVRVNVTRSGQVTAYQTVRTTVRFRNVGTESLVLGYRKGSGLVSDNTGAAYTWSDKAFGIGVVDANAADAQFRLAPGESRDAQFESTLQYNVRNSQPGQVFSHDIGIVQLAVVAPGQVRTVQEHALSFSNLSARAGFAAGGGDSTGGAADAANAAAAAEAVGKVVELFKSFSK